MRFFLVFAFCLGHQVLLSQNLELSLQSQISIITADPGQEALFTVFGHSAIRVVDPLNQIDYAFNYGVFDFDQPNFYLNFARGYLNYMLAQQETETFVYQYVYFKRSVHEQVLDLSLTQRQAVFDFLTNNVKPENRYYLYDYFYDNCATRVRDVFENVLGEELKLDLQYLTPKDSFRSLVDSLAYLQPWGDLGIDLCLGLPMDKKINAYEYMFLPEYIRQAFGQATVENTNGLAKPLVKKSRLIYESNGTQATRPFLSPQLVFWSLFTVLLVFTYLGYRKQRAYRIIDIIWFGILGLLGVLLFALWFATDHNAAAWNLNLLWAIPLHLPAAFILLKKEKPAYLKYYFIAVAALTILLLITWPWNPQGYNTAFFPIALVSLLRSSYLWYTWE
ncbi:MAG: DUF4105 domain-containing protein [Cyclobacteriaceae bacterium]